MPSRKRLKSMYILGKVVKTEQKICWHSFIYVLEAVVPLNDQSEDDLFGYRQP